MIEKKVDDFLEKVDFATRKNFVEFSEFMKGLSRTEKSCFTKKFMDYADEDNPDINLLDIGYNCHKMYLLDPHQVWIKGKYLFGIVSLSRVLMITLIFTQILENHGDMIYVVNCAKSISAFLQGFSKAIPIFTSSEYMIYIHLVTISRFWTKSQNRTEADNYKFWRIIMETYKYTAYLLFTIMIMSSIMYDALIFDLYVPNFPFAARILALLQYCELTIDLLLVIGIDLIFVSCCVIIWRQAKLLIEEFTLIGGKRGYEKTMKQLERCVVHHDFLLDYVNCVIFTFRIPLLLQYGISILWLFIDLYLLAENPSIVELSASIIYLGMLIFQIGLYCFIADKTCEMVETVPSFLYKTKWYNNPLYLNKLYRMVLCRSQKEVSFTSGGMVKINKEGFTSIFKTTLSFYTLVRQMKDGQ